MAPQRASTKSIAQEASSVLKISLGKVQRKSLVGCSWIRASLFCLLLAAMGYQSVWVEVAPPTVADATAAAASVKNRNHTMETAHVGDASIGSNLTVGDSVQSSTSIVALESPAKNPAVVHEKTHRLHNIEIDSRPILDYLQRELETTQSPLGNTTGYQQQHCDLQNRPWCPSGRNTWQRRAPHFMILGVKKAGSSSLYFALTQHPKIVSAQRKELLFFSQKRFQFDKYLSVTSKNRDPSDKHLINTTHMVNVQTIRDDLTKKFRLGDLLKDPEAISFDATPQYIFNFPTAPRPILCACPWVKLIVILRDPVDRLWSHFNFIKGLQLKYNKETNAKQPMMKMSFEDWVLKDLHRMKKRGLLAGSAAPWTEMDEQSLIESWHDYAADFDESPVGRGFYGLQIYQWMKELRRIGRDPRHVLKVVRLEDLKSLDGSDAIKPRRILEEITDWLLLDGKGDGSAISTNSAKRQIFRQHMGTRYSKLGDPVLSNRTREWVDAFYAPQNAMLARLLGDERWDYSKTKGSTKSGETMPLVWPANEYENNATIGGAKQTPIFAPSSYVDIAINDPCSSQDQGHA